MMEAFVNRLQIVVGPGCSQRDEERVEVLSSGNREAAVRSLFHLVEFAEIALPDLLGDPVVELGGPLVYRRVFVLHADAGEIVHDASAAHHEYAFIAQGTKGAA